MTIGIQGAGGELGRGTADRLLERVEPGEVVLITRDPSKLEEYAQRGATVRHGDYDEPHALREAYRGVDRLLLISGVDVGRRVEQHATAVEAAKEAGVGHVMYTSIVNPTEANPAAATPEHMGTEDAILESGLDWTMLRNGIYADLTVFGLLQSIEAGSHVFNSGDGKTAFVARDDCAAVAAAVLAGVGHEGKAYDITGPEPLSGADLARIASEVSGKPVEPVSVDDEAFIDGLVEHAGLPSPVAEFIASFGRAAREGQLATVSGEVERLTGTSPRSLRQLLEAAVSES